VSDVHRETCLWLAELASWRPGVSSRLVARYGDLSVAISRPREELVAVLQGRREASRSRPGAGARRTPARHRATARRRGSVGKGDGERRNEGDGERYRAALTRLGPSRSRGGPPGSAAVAFTDSGYPSWLRAIADPPPALFLDGECQSAEVAARWRRLLAAPRVAVVGCRRPSPYGLEMASGIADELVEAGVVVVSGLAFGIDAAAHRGALRDRAGREVEDAGPPPTLAVMGCGADVCSPRSHRTLWTAVRRRGLVVSEFVGGTPPRAWRYPARNRVMAGLCHGVVVVEGTSRSGALITGDRALEGGREVLAVPGEVGRSVTEGPHGLLRDGAALCESGACVVAVLDGIRREDPDVFDPWRERRRATGRLEADKPAAAGRGDGGEISADVGGRTAGAGGARDGTTAAEKEGCVSSVADDGSPALGRVMEVLDRGPSAVDELVEQTGLEAAQVLSSLAAAELAGDVACAYGGVYRAVRGRGRRRNPPVGRRTPPHGGDTGHDVRA